MATRVISTSIKLDGEAEFKKQMSSVNSELKTLRSEMAYNEEAFKGQANTMEALTAKDKLLRKEIEQQEEKVKALEKAVSEATEAYGENDKRTDNWRQSLNRAKTELVKMNRELEDTDKYLDEAKDSADGCAKSIDKFGKEAQDSGKKIGGVQGLLDKYGDKLKMLGVAGAAGMAVKGLKEVAGAIMEVEESTREYRQIMGTLEVSAQSAGYAAEETAQTYGRLQSVLGDTQTAATATANLQALQLEQDKLMELTDSAIGAWARYGDSIPIDGLSEAINETVRVGQVTGTFADVLNWGAKEGETYGVKLKEANEANEEWNKAVMDCKSAEDYFNLALQDCETQSERVDLVLKAMSDQGLSDAADAWVDLNDDIVKANESQARMDEAMGKLGESLAPAANALRDFGANAISWLADQIENATKAWNDFRDAVSKGDISLSAARERGGYDGSHAGGLSRVPYDGYIAETHRDEAILNAQEAQIWRQFRAGSYQTQPGVTAAELQTMLVGAVNAINSQRGGGIPHEIDLRLKTDDGQTMGRWLVPFVRSEDKSNPEVVSDR